MRWNSADQAKQISAVSLACLLAGALVLVVAALNLFERGATTIGYEQLQQLLERGLVKQIALDGDHLEIRLGRAVRLEELRERPVTEHLLIQIAEPPTDDEVKAWRERGIDIVASGDLRRPSQCGRSIFLGLVSAGLLASGVWYLIAQARANRRSPGPRQRLRDVELDYLAGRMTRAEYETQVDCISAEL